LLVDWHGVCDGCVRIRSLRSAVGTTRCWVRARDKDCGCADVRVTVHCWRWLIFTRNTLPCELPTQFTRVDQCVVEVMTLCDPITLMLTIDLREVSVAVFAAIRTVRVW
jgi:hypothetical protein